MPFEFIEIVLIEFNIGILNFDISIIPSTSSKNLLKRSHGCFDWLSFGLREVFSVFVDNTAKESKRMPLVDELRYRDKRDEISIFDRSFSRDVKMLNDIEQRD